MSSSDLSLGRERRRGPIRDNARLRRRQSFKLLGLFHLCQFRLMPRLATHGRGSGYTKLRDCLHEI
jgi:hypothetical protein